MRDIRPINGACVWHGGEMAESPRWQRRLSPAQLAEIDAALAAVAARGLGWDEMTREDFPLPSFAPLADDIRAELEEGSGILLLRGIEPGRYTQQQQIDPLRRPVPPYRHAGLLQPGRRDHA
jgi:hypothetical protein